jgi:uroporphyrinogen decarboxylase
MTRGFYLNLLDYLGWQKEETIALNPQLDTVWLSEKMGKFLRIDPHMAFMKADVPPRPWQRSWVDETGEYMVNAWKIKYRKPPGGIYFDVSEPPLADADEDEDDAYVWPESKVSFAAESIAAAKKLHDAGEFVIAGAMYGNGFLQNGPYLYGYENWYSMIIIEQDRVRRNLEKLLEKKIEYFKCLFEACGDYIDMVCEVDDLGMQKSTLISKSLFQELFLPYHRTLWAEIKKMRPGVKIWLHSCGSIAPFIGDLIDAGLDVLNPVQINAANMDPLYLKKEFGKDITFWGGGADTQIILPTGTRQQVVDHVKRNIDAFAPGGGFVFSSVHNIQPDVRPENFMTAWETFQEYCKY